MPPPKKPAPPLKLEFTTNSLRNTTIAVGNDKFYYEIVTRYWHPNTTKINKLDVESREFKTIAEIEKVPGKNKEPKVRFRKPTSALAKEKEPEGGDEVMDEWIKASDFLKFDPLKPCVYSFSIAFFVSAFTRTRVTDTQHIQWWDRCKRKCSISMEDTQTHVQSESAFFNTHRSHS